MTTRSQRLLVLILSVSASLRVVLVLQGGQNYWPDEVRYGRSRELAAALQAGDWGAARRVLSLPDHVFFTVLGLAPSILESATRPSAKVAALFFALFSVAAIFLVWKLLRVLGESERTALLAALLLALSTTYLYYSRHLLPYDAAMTLGLGALVAGLRSPARPRDSVLCGVLAAAAFLTYNGAWLLAGVALLAHIARPPATARAAARRGAGVGIGFVIPFLVLFGLTGGRFVERMTAFAGSASQGDYREGWSLPLAYFWHAEHLIAVLWALALAWAIRRLARGDRRAALVLGVAGIFVIYAGLVLTSVVLERMVVYGRLARQLVPFACILTAMGVEAAWSASREGRRAAVATLVLAVAQASVNFARPMTQVFPAEFRSLAATEGGPGPGRRLLFAEHIYPAPTPQASSGVILLERPHPLQFLPYQYEGYTPSARAALRSTDIRMRLVREP